MPIHFDMERMARAVDSHERWWRGELERPLVRIVIPDAHPVERRSPAPLLSQQSCAALEWSPEAIVDALDEELSRQEYLGDAVPFVGFEAFGPGVLAALCGARLDNSSGNVWFFPDEEREIGDIHVRYDPSSVWARRIKAIYRAGLERWNGLVVMGMPDLGGVLDVAATFRGSESLLTDLYDEPEEVLRLRDEIHRAWYDAYADFSAVLAPQNVHSDWSGLLSREPSYILQCDFCYMIGNPMFREFVLETLERDTQRLTNTIYHLDGIGELRHLDDVLALKDLNAVQWVPGDGQPGAPHWLDVYRKIADAGKRMMIVGGPGDFLDVQSRIHGEAYTVQYLRASDAGVARALLEAR